MEQTREASTTKKSDLREFEVKLKEVMAHSSETRDALKTMRNGLLDNKTVRPSEETMDKRDKEEQPKNRIIDCSDKVTIINGNLTTMNQLITEIKGMVE